MVCEKCGNKFEQDYRKYPKGRARFCSRKCANSKEWSQEDKKKKSKSARNSEKVKKANKKKIKWNQDKKCVICGNEIRKKTSFYCRSCYVKYNKNYLNAIKNNGGLREKSGRGKSGFFKGYHCSSTWELAYIIYLLDNNSFFERNSKKFKYTNKEGEDSYYIPDFIVNGKYVEIKGPQDFNWNEKKKHFPFELKSIEKEDIDFYIEYAKNRYNVNDLSLLYEDIENKYCKECGKILYKKNKSGYCRKHVYLYRYGPVD